MTLQKIDPAVFKREPDIRGSVQNLYKIAEGGKKYMLCRTSDSGSVFDVGTIFSVPESDLLRTAVRHFIYTALGRPETWQALAEEDLAVCLEKDKAAEYAAHPLLESFRKNGVRTHHIGMVDTETGEIYRGTPPRLTPAVLVEEFPVLRPERVRVLGRFAWDYHHYLVASRKVVALENVFRLGNPGGSSLYSRYLAAKGEGGDAMAKSFLKSVGLKEDVIEPWMFFEDMIYDCTTKYEPEDRYLSWQETVLVSGVPADVFEELARTLVYCTAFASKFFRELGFQLWDLKWEAAVDGATPVVVDTIDPDSVRVTGMVDYDGKKVFVHFNKQSVRDYYKLIHAGWYDSINHAKKLAKTDSLGRSFMEIYREGVKTGEYPEIPKYDEKFARIQSRKYAMMVEPLVRPDQKGELAREAQDLMRQEIDLFKNAGQLDKLLQMNSVP